MIDVITIETLQENKEKLHEVHAKQWWLGPSIPGIDMSLDVSHPRNLWILTTLRYFLT